MHIFLFSVVTESGESYSTKCGETDAAAGVRNGRKISNTKNWENCKEIKDSYIN